MKNQKLPLDEVISAGGALISNSQPKTIAGKVLRWLKKLIQVKDSLNIKVKK